MLAAAVAAMHSGQSTLLEISGEPGIGKTRLMNALAGMAEQSGAQVVGTCAVRNGFPSYGALHDVLGELFNQGQAGVDVDLFDRVSARVTEWANPVGGVLLLDDFHLFGAAAASLAALPHTNARAPFCLALAPPPR